MFTEDVFAAQPTKKPAGTAFAAGFDTEPVE
jgi:hypothetical protein